MANFITQNPLLSLVVISIVIQLATTLIYKYTTNQVRLKEIADERKKLSQELKDNKNDMKKLQEVQNKQLALAGESFKHSMKSLLITMVPLLIVYSWIGSQVKASEVILKLPFEIPKIGDNTGFGWLGILFLTSLILTPALRKILKVY